MDVDIDLEEYSDRISDFLRSNLREIKSQNANLETSLKHRKEISSHLREQIAQSTTNDTISLGDIWKKIVNGKYVLGVEMKNDSAK